MKTEPSTPFSNGTEYENFMYYFCWRCKKGLINENGFAEYPENGGRVIWDAMENARWDKTYWPADKIVQGEKDGRKYWHICTAFDGKDGAVVAAYKNLLEAK